MYYITKSYQYHLLDFGRIWNSAFQFKVIFWTSIPSNAHEWIEFKARAKVGSITKNVMKSKRV